MFKNRAKQYDVKLKVSRDGTVKIKQYKHQKYKDLTVIDDDEKIVKNGRIAKEDLTDDSSIRVDSLTRSRNLIIDYASNNCDDWVSFITLTFKENIKDLDYANKEFNKWRTAMSRACKRDGFDFKYLGVPEFQKRGAVHYHLLTNLQCGSKYLEFQKGIDDGTKMYDVKYWKHGFSSGFDVIKDTDDKFNVALYILKYLYKDLDERLFGHTRVLKSNNLEKPNEYYLMQNNDTYIRAMNYIKEKRYDLTNVFVFEPKDSYITPFTSLDFNSSNRVDNNTLQEILQNDGIEF